MGGALKAWLRRLAARAVRPGLAGLEARTRRIEAQVAELLARSAPDPRKYEEEIQFWRWLVRSDEARARFGGPFEEVFGRWQRDRLRELGACLGLNGDSALDAWCARQSVVEIGGGPYPAVAASPAWRRAVAVDPLAKAYADEGLLARAAANLTYVEAPGERVPLATACADLVIIENALDHVSDPAAVLSECRRLLRPGGLLWLLVDLSTYRDHMHPHPFDEKRIRGMLVDAGFEAIRDRVSEHKSHPKAYGEYRGLLRKPGGREGVVEAKPDAARAPL
jgi:SAM-dependent methyltransferase